MDFLHKVVQLAEGDVVEVTLDHPANVQLLDDANYELYSQGKPYRYQGGGYATKSAAQVAAPSAGRWHLTVDLGVVPGSRHATGLRAMRLTTEDLGDVPDVDAATLAEVLATDGFGKFAILAKSDAHFIQAGNDWQPGEACRAFMQAHDSDPWLLEYREAERQFQAAVHVTLDQVRRAFASYLAGGQEWRSGFAWSQVSL